MYITLKTYPVNIQNVSIRLFKPELFYLDGIGETMKGWHNIVESPENISIINIYI